MARPKKYKDTQEAHRAQLERNKRYIDEKTEMIRAHLPKGYKDKLEYITKELNISRAQYIKNCIDTTYNELTGGKDMQKD